RRKPSAPRRRAPGDVAQLVARHVIAQRLEIPPLAAPGRATLRRDERASAERLQLRLARPPDVRVDLHDRRQAHAILAPDETEPRRVTHGDATELEATAARRLQRVDERQRLKRPDVQLRLARREQVQLRRVLVLNLQTEGA